jgi:hypothetical protein
VAAGYNHSLGLKADGSIVGWGGYGGGGTEMPVPNSGFVAIAAGTNFSLGLRSDGSLAGFGIESTARWRFPSPTAAMSACPWAGAIAWRCAPTARSRAGGDDLYGETTPPVPNEGFVAVSAGSLPQPGPEERRHGGGLGQQRGWATVMPVQTNGGFTTIHASQATTWPRARLPALTLTLMAPDSLSCSGDPSQPLPFSGQLLVENLTGAACDYIQVSLVGGIGVVGGFSLNLGTLAAGASHLQNFALEGLPPFCGGQLGYTFLLQSNQTPVQQLDGQFYMPCCGKPEVTIEYIHDTDMIHLDWTAVVGAQAYHVYSTEQGWPVPGVSTLLGTTTDTWLEVPRLSLPPTQFIVVTAQFQ